MVQFKLTVVFPEPPLIVVRVPSSISTAQTILCRFSVCNVSVSLPDGAGSGLLGGCVLGGSLPFMMAVIQSRW